MLDRLALCALSASPEELHLRIAMRGMPAATCEAPRTGFSSAPWVPAVGRPDLGSWPEISNTVSRGLALIVEGALDGRKQASKCWRGGWCGWRVLFAKRLVHDTCMPITEIAIATGLEVCD